MALIDADKLLARLGMARDCENCPNRTALFFCGLSREESNICDEIANAPIVDPVPHAEWSYEQHFRWGGWRCTNCGAIRRRKNGMRYCPNCGAKMEAYNE